MKKYNVRINYGGIVEAENEEKAKEEFRNCIDNTFFKLECKELEEAKGQIHLFEEEEQKIINWIDKRIKESEKLLINTDYLSVITGKQKESIDDEDREHNNFEAGVISGLKELKEKLEKEELKENEHKRKRSNGF